MILKLKESILCKGEHYLPPAVIDTEALGITDDEADVLLRRGTAVVAVDEQTPEESKSAAESEAAALAAAALEAEAAPRANRKKA